MCVVAPVLEEVLYRLALCVPLAVWLGPWTAIVVSGLAFAGLHVAAGNPSPENLVGGLFLAWAYLKSESIFVPVLLHSLGNLCALAGQVGTWYWLGSAA
jgi:membrane protease YdiL (CAAX protease family)